MNKKTMTSEFIKNIHEQSASLFLILLLCADLAFIALHTIEFIAPSLNNPLLSLERDHGFPEVYQYIKWFWIIVLLVFISTTRRSINYSAWGLFFTYLLLDDALEIHERVGILIAENLTLTPPLGLRLQDLGELAVAGTAGVVLLLLVLLAYLYGSQAFKKMSLDMLLLILALAFFGVIVDMVHVIAHLSIQIGWKVSAVLAVIEDGGEMFVASLILWYVFLLCMRDENATSFLFDFVHEVLTKRST